MHGSSIVIRILNTARGDLTFEGIPVNGAAEAIASLGCYRGTAQPPRSSANNQEVAVDQAVKLAQLVQEFEATDAELNAVYQRARALLPEPVFVELRDTQRDWLEGRDAWATVKGFFN